MKRILMSLVVIGAVVALIGGTFAQFSTQDSATGNVTAATISIDVLGQASGSLTLTCGAGGVLPGEDCTDATVEVKNESVGVNAKITVSDATVTSNKEGAGCNATNLTVTGNALDMEGKDIIAAGALSKDHTLKATLDVNAPNTCQGTVFTVKFDVTAEATRTGASEAH